MPSSLATKPPRPYCLLLAYATRLPYSCSRVTASLDSSRITSASIIALRMVSFSTTYTTVFPSFEASSAAFVIHYQSFSFNSSGSLGPPTYSFAINFGVHHGQKSAEKSVVFPAHFDRVRTGKLLLQSDALIRSSAAQYSKSTWLWSLARMPTTPLLTLSKRACLIK